ncbi:oligopeptide ABC transporter substrate-binding protein [Virgibacillus dokdonensis]|uniref:Oligopeptide ABC transporter substrate-binding protein n=1 Tax=Virgibacillus dokdonensis TaxID=302167 RepID=A0A3E0WWD1_9BACI|nr:peptide ABC transporter substrate-binding protein [Virgibacillus dokdonensis]RFA36699.1 oligopeptide ABC transporter substrate-binding protein [Virgibacillus dokdonensis]
MKKGLLYLMGVLVFLVLAACTANESTGTENKNGEGEKAGDEKILQLNNGEEPTSFDPAIGFDNVSWNALNNLMEGLTRLDEDHTPQPAVAEEWDVSEDGTTYTFYLRDDANWSNGDPVVAEDFIYAWERLLNPKTGSSAGFLGYFIKGGEAFNSGEGSTDDLGITAVDEKTLEVELENPTGFFLHVLTNPAFFPVNHQVAADNSEWHAEAESFVGNGPFQLESWEHDNEMMFTKNDAYWDADSVNLDGVHWAMVNDTNTEYQMFERGELDSAEIPAELSDQLIDGDNVQVVDQGGLEFFRFNVTEEPFQNKNIRKAFALAVDQENITEYVVKNKVKPAYGYISPGFTNPSGEDFRDVNGDLVSFDPEEAKQLLEKGMEEEGYDELPTVTLSYNTSDLNKEVAEAIQGMFSENIGVDVELENTEWNVFLEDQKALNHQLSRSSFLYDYADPVNFLESFITGSYMNRTGWSNEQYDQLIANAKSEADEGKRWEYMYEAEKLLAEEVPLFPVRYYNQVEVLQEGVTKILRHPVGYLDLKYADKQ